jgi:hypothetical protein
MTTFTSLVHIRKFTIALCLGAGLCGLAAAQAFDMPSTPPKGPVLIKITGNIGAKNTPDAAAFDQALLDALPQKTYATKTPWFKEPMQFTGPLLRDVLASVKAKGTLLNALALNDYKVLIPMDDATKYDVIVATKMNGKAISVREKGPIFIMYPFDDVPDLKNGVFYSRSIWQLQSVSVQ